MKRVIMALLISILVFNFAACAEQVEEVKQTDNNANIESIAEPTEQPNQESFESSATPKPTLSEEEKRILEKYDELMSYCENYNDWSAAVLIKEMYNAGEISEKEFHKLAQISGFEDTRDMSDEIWTQVQEHIRSISDIANGQLDGLNEAGMDKFYQNLCMAAQHGTVYINALDTQDKKERIAQGIAYIDQWIREPNEDNFALVEDVIKNDALTSGEIMLVCCHMYYASGEDNERTDYLDNQGVRDIMDVAYGDLLAQNNSKD